MYHDNAEHIQVNVQHGSNNVCRPHSLVHVFLLNNLEILLCVKHKKCYHFISLKN